MVLGIIAVLLLLFALYLVCTDFRLLLPEPKEPTQVAHIEAIEEQSDAFEALMSEYARTGAKRFMIWPSDGGFPNGSSPEGFQ
jgi:predicted tellurium resistance membrane protein TerC